MQILNNPWFIGIGGGILSGFVVTVITRYLFSRRDNREYAQKVVTANQEIIYAVRPGVSEGVIPNVDVLNSLIRATSGKYGVDTKDLYGTWDIADALTKEVMDTSFLSASAKAEFCEKLTSLQESPDQIQIASAGGSRGHFPYFLLDLVGKIREVSLYSPYILPKLLAVKRVTSTR